MIKAIIFDCFGVLAEDGWMPFKRKFIGDNKQMADAVADLGKQNEYGMIDNKTHLQKMAALMSVDAKELAIALGKQVPNEELFEYITADLKPKYKIGLMSNANYNVVQELFTPEQASLFDASVMSYESRLIKPDERMFALIAKRLGVAMNECVFIDDQERYCVAANDLGMTSFVYTSFNKLKHDLSEVQKS
jgi:HAD superfamily hydrolase (TIGR01509 family)